MSRMIELATEVMEDSPEGTKSILVVIGSVLLAEKFKERDWLEIDLKDQGTYDD